MQPPNYARMSNGGYMSLAGATSEHPGGLNVLFCDGGVVFIPDSVSSWPLDPGGKPNGSSVSSPGRIWSNLPSHGIWQAMATRTGGDNSGW
jgi:prepilin-type processing-associated H-X9-DG protein